MISLFERDLAGWRVSVVATERCDGDVHPTRVDSKVLAQRQTAIAGSRWNMADQIHGRAVLASTDDSPDWPLVGRGDVLVGATGPLAVWAADCAPLMLIGERGTLVGCHGGWRGLAAGVVTAAVDAMAGTDDTVAAVVLGPVIHPCCYEFGASELVKVAAGVGADAADVTGSTSSGDTALDVPAAVAAALARHGLGLDVVGPCTGCDDRWFSHRVRGDVGRHAVVGWTTPTDAARMRT